MLPNWNCRLIPDTQQNGMLLDEYFGYGVLYIDRFYIRPEYRGKGIGQTVFPSMLDVLGRDAGVITIIPSPAEDNGRDKIEYNDSRYKAKFKGMTKFIERFDFVEVDKSEKVWAKNPALKD